MFNQQNLLDNIKFRIRYLAGLPQERRVRQLFPYKITGNYSRIYHYHIPKTGGTSLLDMIMHAVNPENWYEYRQKMEVSLSRRTIFCDKVFLAGNKVHIKQGYYYYSSTHKSIEVYPILPGTFSITGFRDPVERVISYYKMLKHYQGLPKNDKRAHVAEIAHLGNDFSDFLKHLPKTRLLRQLFIFSERMDIEEALSRIRKMSFIYFLETFKEDMRVLFQRLDLNEPNFHRDMQSQYEFSVTADERTQLRELMEPEYQLLEQVKQIKLSG